MDAHALLLDFRGRGITLIADGEKLTASPASRLSDADRSAIRSVKSDLLRILSTSDEVDAVKADTVTESGETQRGASAPERVTINSVLTAFDATLVDVRPAPVSPVAVELIYVEPQPKVTPVDPRFPPCRRCGSRRFWITATGKVVCGRPGCGEVCYILASIEFHPIA